MTERNPREVHHESWVERQIREASERGAFDDLPGLGKPLPGLHERKDELWWIRDKVEREGLSTEALLPEPLQLRKEIQRLPETVREMRSEQQVRDTAETLNRRVVEWLRAPSGPRIPVSRVDVEELVESWREQCGTSQESAPREGTPAVPQQAPWWRRLFRRGTA